MKLRSETNTSKMIGYKIAKVGETRVVVTLEIPDDAVTNMSRKDIVDMNTAKHRANKAKVLKIEDENGKEYESAKSFSYNKKSLEYVVNDTITVNDYDMKLDEVCSTGIHFFLSRHCAELYGLNKIQNGVYQSWYNNGQKCDECTYVNGELDGLFQSWYDNGQKWYECTYVNGKYHGLFQSWYKNGQKCKEITYVNGNKHGLYQYWYENGQKYEECTYVNGKIDGLFQSWYDNGQKWYECTYVNGNKHGLYQSWDDNGQKEMECRYVNGWRLSWKQNISCICM